MIGFRGTMPAKAPVVSVVLPAFNEDARLDTGLRQIVEHLRERAFEIVVVDDGSRDGTAEIAERWAREDARVRLVRLETNCGKGAALRAGISRTSGDWVLVTDVDLSAPIEELAVLEKAAPGIDVVIGSRAIAGARLLARQPARRERLGRWFNTAARLIALPGILDTQCGFKLWRGPVARAVFRRSVLDRFAFDVETLWRAKTSGYRLREVPIRWSHDGRSTVRVGRDGLQMLLDLLRLLLIRSLGS